MKRILPVDQIQRQGEKAIAFSEQTGETSKANATLRKKDGKRMLVIKGESIAYGFKGDGVFLVLIGEFEYNKKNVNLTGMWGASGFK